MLDARDKKILDGLRKFTKDCREDMHEPDEQGISATVVGDHLDNACGDFISTKVINRYQEFVVVLKNDKKKQFTVNLADLIALARRAT
jgi:hypothetical protein